MTPDDQKQRQQQDILHLFLPDLNHNPVPAIAD